MCGCCEVESTGDLASSSTAPKVVAEVNKLKFVFAVAEDLEQWKTTLRSVR